MSEPITHKDAFQLLETGVRLGTLPAFAYVLGAHVLHRLSAAGVRQAMYSVEDLYGVVLRDDNGRYCAGQLEKLIHEGAGTPVLDPKHHISVLYVDALQKLHWAGILHNDIVESRLDSPDSHMTHFTMRPELREGVHWRESTPIVWRLPKVSLEAVVDAFIRQCDTTDAQKDVVASFL